MITASRVAADPLFEGTAQDGVFRSPDQQVPSAVLYNMEALFILRSTLKLRKVGCWLFEAGSGSRERGTKTRLLDSNCESSAGTRQSTSCTICAGILGYAVPFGSRRSTAIYISTSCKKNLKSCCMKLNLKIV